MKKMFQEKESDGSLSLLNACIRSDKIKAEDQSLDVVTRESLEILAKAVSGSAGSIKTDWKESVEGVFLKRIENLSKD